MKKLLLANLMFLFLILGAYAEPFRFSVNTGILNMTGDTSYDIRFYTYDSDYGRIDYESLLEFDINAALLNIGFEAGFMDDRFILSLDVAESIIEHGGDFRDRDWEWTDYYEVVWGDTTSDVDSEVSQWDFRFKWNFLEFKTQTPLSINCSAGLKHQEFGTFSPKNIEGFYLNDDGTRDYFYEEYATPVLTYDVEYYILYTGIGIIVEFFEKLTLNASIDIGAVEASDKDDHVLRMKLSESDTNGSFLEGTGYFAGNFEAMLKLTDYLGISFYLQLVSIETDGYQNQYFYDENGYPTEYLGEVYDEVTSEQAIFGGKVQLNF